MTDGSVTHWIGLVKGGDASVAEQQLWDHYFSRLATLARRQLQDLPPHLHDDEDLALSALNSFFTRAKQEGFSRLHNRTDLWQLLAKITVRKTIRRRRSTHAQKRGSGKGNMELTEEFHHLATTEPSPAVLAEIHEECQRLLGSLNPELQTVARMKLEGYTNREIATKLDRVERTVERKLDRIRRSWVNQVERT